jgi:hypothetical protein
VLVNLQTNTLDIHRILNGASCALQRVGQLSLPFSLTNTPSLFASFRLAQACPPSYSSRSRCLPFHPSPDACLIGLTATLVARDGTTTFHWLAIHPDHLCSIAETKHDSDMPTSWETWSPRTACCIEIEHSSAAPTPAGTRWLVHSQPLVIREFGLSRSKRTQAGERTHRDEGIGDVVLREALQDVLASQLPFFDVAVSIGERKYKSVIADYEWVVGIIDEVRSASPCTWSAMYSRIQMQGDGFSITTRNIDIYHVI